MNLSSRVTEKGQATVPKELREKYDICPGDELAWSDTGNGISVKKQTRTTARGILLPADANKETRQDVAGFLAEHIHNHRNRYATDE